MPGPTFKAIQRGWGPAWDQAEGLSEDPDRTARWPLQVVLWVARTLALGWILLGARRLSQVTLYELEWRRHRPVLVCLRRQDSVEARAYRAEGLDGGSG